MASGFIVKFQRYTLYVMSVVMGLGTINPFEKYNPNEEPKSFLIYPALILIIIAFLADFKSLRRHYNKLINSELSLLALWFTIVLSGVLYGLQNLMSVEFSYEYTLKMLFAFLAYYLISYLFISTKDGYNNLLIYSITCILLVLPFFLNIGSSDFYHFSNGRLIMYGENPNSFSARLGIAVLFFSYSLTIRNKGLIYKLLAISAIITLLFFILLSGSRGSFAIVVFCSFIMFVRQLSIKQIILTFIPILAIAFYVLVKNSAEFSIFQRFETLQDKGDSREILMGYAIDIWESYLILGCGQNGYLTEKLSRFNNPLDSHCIVTSVLAMGGIVGLFWFLRFIIINFSLVWPFRKVNALPLILFLFMFFISLKTGGIITYFLMYYIYAYSASEGYLLKNTNVIKQIRIKPRNEYTLHYKSQH